MLVECSLAHGPAGGNATQSGFSLRRYQLSGSRPDGEGERLGFIRSKQRAEYSFADAGSQPLPAFQYGAYFQRDLLFR